jgi:thiol-disulfide isomerase/thioredoxin
MKNPTRPACTLVRVPTGFLVASAALLFVWPVEAGEPERSAAPQRPASSAVIHLTNGGFVTGELADCNERGRIRWQPDCAVAPFDFALGAVNAVHFPVPIELPRPEGEYCFELAGGDVLFGSLVRLEEAQAEIDAPRIGRIQVIRSLINRMYRWRSSGDLIYLGPNGLVGWRETSGRKGWREEQGQPWTDQDGSAIRGDFRLPARASVEFEISWKNKPDFVLALGVDDDDKSTQRAFRFEVWERDLIIQRETEQEADVASVREIVPGPGRVHLIAYLDQERGRILVFTADGKPLADLKVAAAQTQVLGGLSLLNKRGDLRLERLRIGRWNGEPPRQVEEGKARIHRLDGSIVYGQISRYDAVTKSFAILEAQGQTRVAEDQIAGVFLSQPREAKGRSVAVVYQDGTRLSGDLEEVDKTELRLKIEGINKGLHLSREGLRSLVALAPDSAGAAIGGLAGTLELDGVRLPGKLVDGREAPGASCLTWQPQGSSVGSPLRPGVSGRIIYREPPPPRPAARREPPPQGPGGFVVGFLSALGGNQPAQPAGKRKALYLRSGDVIPSEITSIDESGVSFRTSLSASTFVPHNKVKAVELAQPSDVTIKLSKAKRERLLTLPRMQKENPPTHLIRSRNGDYMRGRLIKLDDQTLEVEIRLEPRTIPRSRLASIVWLHPDELDVKEKAAEGTQTSKTSKTTTVQAVCADGIRLTFVPSECVGGKLSGKSDVLGPCQVQLKEMNQLLIGAGIEKAASLLVYQQWKLQNAAEPREAPNESGQSSSARPPGTESALVGKSAPDFTLDLLEGRKFQLAQRRGKVVILDFWATWCGPCLQAMPQVEAVAKEFRDRGVELIAVNLQEEPNQITSMLERHKLQPTVVLDRDGVVAEKYAASAIPQTVIIDRAGTIVRLFVGGGPHLGDQLREALNHVLKGNAGLEPARQEVPRPPGPR